MSILLNLKEGTSLDIDQPNFKPSFPGTPPSLDIEYLIVAGGASGGSGGTGGGGGGGAGGMITGTATIEATGTYAVTVGAGGSGTGGSRGNEQYGNYGGDSSIATLVATTVE